LKGGETVDDLRVSIFCPYCKNHTSLTPAPATPRTIKTGFGFEEIKTTAVWQRAHQKDRWWIGICNYCNEPVLVHNVGDIVYPNPLPSPTDERIPETIRQDLNEAKICLSINAYCACAVMARRAIQSACIDKEATKEKLSEQLQELASNAIITRDLKEWADVVRWVGNDAAHPNSGGVSKGDAEDILKLAKQFLDVIYVAPAIAKEQRTKRDK